MNITKRLYSILFIVLCIVVLAIVYFYMSGLETELEGFLVKDVIMTRDTPVAIIWVNKDLNQVAKGYYQINETLMRQFPTDYTSVSPMPDVISENNQNSNYTETMRKNIIKQFNSLGYYVAEYVDANGVSSQAVAMLPKANDIFTPPPQPRTAVPYGYYIVKYRKVESKDMRNDLDLAKEEDDKDEISKSSEKLAKLPYGYEVPYVKVTQMVDGAVREVFKEDDNGNYIVKSKQVVYTNRNGKEITITYDQYNPLPTTKTAQEKETLAINESNKGFLPEVIEDDIYLVEKQAREIINYDVGNLEVDYIPTDEKDITKAANAEMIWVTGPTGELIQVPYVRSQQFPTYNQPGSFTYGSSSYVPKYEDSVYLSSTTRLSTLGNVYPTSSSLGGFCNTHKNNPAKLEEKCNSIPIDQCASTSCCVLLGGSKCVYGNDLGPKMKANYSDKFIANKDVYYYQGKCYGNCDK